MSLQSAMKEMFDKASKAIERVGLGTVRTGHQGLESTANLTMGFSKIAERLEYLPTRRR